MAKQKTVLIIEDDKSLSHALADILCPKFSILEAESGEKGVELALSKHPNLILLDLLLPKMDGMTAFKEIRKDPWGKDVPVIILTNVNATDVKLVENMVTNKPLFYLVKVDWKIHDVAKKIEDVLKI